METIANIVLPVFGIILAGYLSRHFGLLGAPSAEALNRFVYYITLPPLLFLTTARIPIEEILNGPFIAAYLSGIGLTLVIAVPGAWTLFGHRDLATLTLHGLATIFANTVYMGIPLFLAAFGQDRTLPVVVAVLVSNVLFIGLAIVLVEIGQTAGGGYRRIGADVAGALGRSPVVMPLLLGLLASYLGLWIPGPVTRFLELLAGATGPTALFTLGLSLYGQPLRGDVREIGWLVLLKLLVNPLITWWLVTYVFELEPFWASSAVLIAAIPSGTLVFVIAQRYGVYIQRSAGAILVSTTLSLVTLSALLAWYGTD